MIHHSFVNNQATIVSFQKNDESLMTKAIFQPKSHDFSIEFSNYLIFIFITWILCFELEKLPHFSPRFNWNQVFWFLSFGIQQRHWFHALESKTFNFFFKFTLIFKFRAIYKTMNAKSQISPTPIAAASRDSTPSTKNRIMINFFLVCVDQGPTPPFFSFFLFFNGLARPVGGLYSLFPSKK